MSMNKKLVIIITEDGSFTKTEYVGDVSLLKHHAEKLAMDIINGRFNKI